jgi:hypothetical protein
MECLMKIKITIEEAKALRKLLGTLGPHDVVSSGLVADSEAGAVFDFYLKLCKELNEKGISE